MDEAESEEYAAQYEAFYVATYGRDAWDAMLAHEEEMDRVHDTQCNASLTIGPAHDPYGTSCDLSEAHVNDDRPVVHAGPHPMGEGRIRWTGGGSVAGDPLPVHIIEELFEGRE